MMSEEASQIAIWSYRVNLDKRIRSDHPLRRINEVLVKASLWSLWSYDTVSFVWRRSANAETSMRSALTILLAVRISMSLIPKGALV
jgi:hypothetical protein